MKAADCLKLSILKWPEAQPAKSAFRKGKYQGTTLAGRSNATACVVVPEARNKNPSSLPQAGAHPARREERHERRFFPYCFLAWAARRPHFSSPQRKAFFRALHYVAR